MSDCPFCDWMQPVMLEEDDVFIIQPLDPVTPGHLLVIPNQHVVDALADPEVTGRVFTVAARYARGLHKPCNLITSAGSEATQTVRHLHVHIVPRYAGDGLALPWTGQQKRETT